jgi:NAD(P)-dependent dehydrogenase (short-subunit alcohol dehydrogenase family)
MISPSSGQVILCTGANRSLGFAILQVTALRLPSATYLLGARSPKDGAEAVEELKKLGITSNIEVLELDVSEDASIFAAIETVQTKYGKLDGKFIPSFPLPRASAIT